MSFEKMLNHTTIREFTKDVVSKEIIEVLKQAANRAASSTGMQQSSIIRVKDHEKRKALAKIGGQEYLARVPELWIFIVDTFRNNQILKEKTKGGLDKIDMDKFFQGFTDGVIQAQQVVTAAESLGLGTVFFGCILNDYEKTIEVLNLPKGTFPIVGLGFGYPNQKPQIKPRMKMDLKFFEDEYKIETNYLEKIKDYDQEMQTYYDTRDQGRRSDCFSDQVVKKSLNIVGKRDLVVRSIVSQGFDLCLDD